MKCELASFHVTFCTERNNIMISVDFGYWQDNRVDTNLRNHVASQETLHETENEK